MYPYETQVWAAIKPAPNTTAATLPTCLRAYPLQKPIIEPKEIFAMIGLALSMAIAMESEEAFSISLSSGIVIDRNLLSLSGSIIAISK